MARCKYCGTTESTKWNLAGYKCTNCRPSCPNCSKADKGFPATRYNGVEHEGNIYHWCAGCGQLVPEEFVNAEPDENTQIDESYFREHFGNELIGMTWKDITEEDSLGDATVRIE